MLAALKNPRTYTPYIFLLPAGAILAIGLLFPLWRALQLSFYDWDMGTPWASKEYVGLDSL